MRTPWKAAGHVPPATTLRDIVGFATRAPSVHNSQPWRWRTEDGGLELRADRARQLAVADPEGRSLVISCGAALEHALVFAEALGWAHELVVLPSPGDPDHLATLRFRPGHPDRVAAAATVELLRERRTDRRRFTAWPLPDDVLRRLAASAGPGRPAAVPLTRPADRVRVDLLVARALWAQRTDPALVSEQARWSDPSEFDGVPRTARPPGVTGERPSRFGELGRAIAVRDSVEPTDGVIVLAGDDAPADWVDAGRQLCRIWIAAMTADLSLVPLSEVVEVAETREVLRREVLGGQQPLLLLRIGWQEIGRSGLPPTPRRPVEEVLVG